MAKSTKRPDAKELVSAYRLARSVARRLKTGRGWTQADAARWWGVSERTWRRYETVPGAAPLALIKRIAKTTTTR